MNGEQSGIMAECRAMWRTRRHERVGFLAGLCVVLSALLSACVTEDVSTPRRGLSVRPATSQHNAPVPMPTGPIAAPALEAVSVSSAVRVAIQPLGVVPFDGQTLPIVSPDGRFLATQTGEAPTWPTVLAQPGAVLPLRAEIEIYDLTHTPPRRISPAEALPPGLLLGRLADDSGFLVESPRLEGARWIGRVSWLRGGVQWLARSDEIASGATQSQSASRTIYYTARSSGSNHNALVIVSPDGQKRRVPNAGRSYLYPLISCGGSRLACFATTAEGLELMAFEAAGDDSLSAEPRIRRVLHPVSDPLLAYQSATPMQAIPLSCDQEPTAFATESFLFFHPAAGRMMIIDAVGDQLLSLAPESISGCWMRDAAGFGVLLTTPDGLVAQRIARTREGLKASPPARLLTEPWAPRATTNPERQFILIGPGPGNDPRRLTLAAMNLLPPQGDEKPAP